MPVTADPVQGPREAMDQRDPSGQIMALMGLRLMSKFQAFRYLGTGMRPTEAFSTSPSSLYLKRVTDTTYELGARYRR
jgi:hypothetical protein